MDLDKLELPFRPRARLLQLLGDQLIGTPRLAVFELVKNAFDADAKYVAITIEDIDTPKTKIIVEDDGEGMSMETIRDIWLVPAHDHRKIQRIGRKRTDQGRLPLGEKGVGRFAVHKLGDRIGLVSHAKDSRECVTVIDWEALIRNPFLEDAIVTVRTREPAEYFPNGKTGTRVVIDRLRENNWSRGEVRRLLRQIVSITSPFADRSDDFKIELKIPDHPDWVSGIPDIESVIQRAPWRFHFTFKDGLIDWQYEFKGVTGIKLSPRETRSANGESLQIFRDRDLDRLGSDQNSKEPKGKNSRRIVAGKDQTDGIGPVEGTFYVFDRDREILSKLGDSQLVRNFLDENGGIRVYRDGVRVYNYGEPGDDWLGLDLRRVNTPTRNISRNIVVGAIDLSLELSDLLEEKTSREGFVENDAFRRLKQIVLGALSILQIERKIDKDAMRELIGKGYDPETKHIEQPMEELRKIAKKYHLSDEIDPLIDRAINKYNEMRDIMLNAGLSGMGLAVVFHEIERGVRVLYDAIEGGGEPRSIQSQARDLVRILDGFTELLRKGERKSNSVKHLIRRVSDINRVRFRNHDVKLTCPALTDAIPDITKNFSFGLMLGALNNLLDNSFYWVRKRWPNESGDAKREIYINIDAEFRDGPAIIVADNGPGFQDNPDRLTRPFFSRRPDGMGLGLYYANLVAELNGGRLAFPDRDEADVPAKFDGAVLALVFEREGKN